MEAVLNKSSKCKRIWIDETYIEYAGIEHSLESFAVYSDNVIVCKSLSKVYALSGMRVAYLCASPHHLEDLRVLTPPWSVSLPAQISAIYALQSADYYETQYQKTHLLREELSKGLRDLGISEIIPGSANFLMFHLPSENDDAALIINKCREYGLFLRNASEMGSSMGSNAIRIAVKDELTNMRMLEIINNAMSYS